MWVCANYFADSAAPPTSTTAATTTTKKCSSMQFCTERVQQKCLQKRSLNANKDKLLYLVVEMRSGLENPERPKQRSFFLTFRFRNENTRVEKLSLRTEKQKRIITRAAAAVVGSPTRV